MVSGDILGGIDHTGEFLQVGQSLGCFEPEGAGFKGCAWRRKSSESLADLPVEPCLTRPGFQKDMGCPLTL
jgi:hypothetical protein